jgi:hypothetical protein
LQDLKEKLDAALRVTDKVGDKIALVLDNGQLCEIYYDLRIVPEEWHFRLWDIYDKVMDMDTIQDQRCYSRLTFIEALLDPAYLKVVLLVDRVPMGMVLGTNNLEKARVAYVNPEYLRKCYPEAARSGKLFYFTCLCFDPETQHQGVLPYFILAAAQSIYDNFDILLADFSSSTYYLKDTTKYFLNLIGSPIAREEILGQQTYFSLVIRENSG